MKKWAVTTAILALCAVGVWALVHSDEPAPPSKNEPAPSQPGLSESQRSRVNEALGAMSLGQKVASLFVFHARGTNPAKLGAFVDKYRPGGFILMGDNIPSDDMTLQKETAALRGSAADFPRLVAIDQEGGVVRRLKGDSFPAALQLRTLPAQATQTAFEKRSDLVRSVGATLNFGIIADVTDDKSSFIYSRVLGTKAGAAGERVAAAVRGTEGKTLSTLKHFPGHGESEADSHQSIPTSAIPYDAWRAKDALPFESGIAAGVDVVMMGHLRYSAVDAEPASLSREWHDILRHELHFSGTIITDDLCMLQNSGVAAYRDPVQNAIRALNAGNDSLLYVLDNAGASSSEIDPQRLIDGVTAAVQSGEVDETRLDDAVRHVLGLRARSADFLR
jgi:beta-N-acetylhexosaminidase